VYPAIRLALQTLQKLRFTSVFLADIDELLAAMHETKVTKNITFTSRHLRSLELRFVWSIKPITFGSCSTIECLKLSFVDAELSGENFALLKSLTIQVGGICLFGNFESLECLHLENVEFTDCGKFSAPNLKEITFINVVRLHLFPIGKRVFPDLRMVTIDVSKVIHSDDNIPEICFPVLQGDQETDHPRRVVLKLDLRTPPVASQRLRDLVPGWLVFPTEPVMSPLPSAEDDMILTEAISKKIYLQALHC